MAIPTNSHLFTACMPKHEPLNQLRKMQVWTNLHINEMDQFEPVLWRVSHLFWKLKIIFVIKQIITTKLLSREIQRGQHREYFKRKTKKVITIDCMHYIQTLSKISKQDPIISQHETFLVIDKSVMKIFHMSTLNTHLTIWVIWVTAQKILTLWSAWQPKGQFEINKYNGQDW